MTRVKIKFPAEKALYIAIIPVRIGDINYGNHVGNDAILSIIHEARMHMLSSWGYTELNIEGKGLILGDVMIAYKAEAFYGDILTVKLYVTEMTERSFDLLYEISTKRGENELIVAQAKTGMVCFDYQQRKISVIPDILKNKLNRL